MCDVPVFAENGSGLATKGFISFIDDSNYVSTLVEILFDEQVAAALKLYPNQIGWVDGEMHVCGHSSKEPVLQHEFEEREETMDSADLREIDQSLIVSKEESDRDLFDVVYLVKKIVDTRTEVPFETVEEQFSRGEAIDKRDPNKHIVARMTVSDGAVVMHLEYNGKTNIYKCNAA